MAYMALLIITGDVCFSSFYFAGLASSPRQKTYLHLNPQSRLFPGTLYVVAVLPSVILTMHELACLCPQTTLRPPGGKWLWVLAVACWRWKIGVHPGRSAQPMGAETAWF